ncbi:uncharacterized protein SPPG_07309 [Spizellomyces punctatus DAOM BR117]|uniref:Uncharacterized protein n=1 Tax=Spizellomyces punctatus (strain DAOM BR117) TaxID=645134 RepID=A0A0L0H822_SPIPD|nr:uncharacterized protein SPPG_07309 [Spizellomyces punctatus DAOM BR117]KNC97382.1 hypothetical protein SPPG_07309 [Spizellomyces punctatus DAOM BR117]|eukprot:XP_016605422.1 hypothetical protein SPPG_07309 [Spizellomyces punctatus DAOM BR117]
MAALLKLAAATTFSRTTTLAGIVSRRNIVLSNRYFGDRKRRDSRSSDGADATENRVEKKGATIKRKVDEIAQKFDDMISEDKILPNTDNPMKMNYTSPPVTERVVDSVKQIYHKAEEAVEDMKQKGKQVLGDYSDQKEVQKGRSGTTPYSAADEAKQAYETAKKNVVEGGDTPPRKL